jgi:hypothetical protein
LGVVAFEVLAFLALLLLSMLFILSFLQALLSDPTGLLGLMLVGLGLGILWLLFFLWISV